MQQTLEQLENDDWGEPQFFSMLSKTVHELRRKPLEQFTVKDLRLMIGQNMGLEHLLPLAMKVLHQTPLAEGTYYEGDLLCAVLECDMVGIDTPLLRAELGVLSARAIAEIESLAAKEAEELLGGSGQALGLQDDKFELLIQEKTREIAEAHPAHGTLEEFLQANGL